MFQEHNKEDGYLPSFSRLGHDSVAKGFMTSNFGLEDLDLLPDDFSYLEPLIGPLKKERYIDVYWELHH